MCCPAGLSGDTGWDVFSLDYHVDGHRHRKARGQLWKQQRNIGNLLEVIGNLRHTTLNEHSSQGRARVCVWGQPLSAKVL